FKNKNGKTFIAVNKSIDDLFATNYLMFQNTSYNTKWFYAFVTSLEYVNTSVTNVYFEIDVFQSWKFEMNFKPSYVLREHRPLWNTDGTPVINTVDEGLNYGTEYDTVKIDNYLPYTDIYFLVIVSKVALHLTSTPITPVLNGSPQPLSYYVHPFRLDGTSPFMQVGSVGLNASTFDQVLKAIYTDEASVNNVVSLYVTEYFGYPPSYDSGNDLLTFDDASFGVADIGSANTIYLKNLPSYLKKSKNFGDKYSGFTTPTESKLLMYPYTVTVLDDLRGNRQEIKNEYVTTNDLTIYTRGSLGTSSKISYHVEDYSILNATSLPDGVASMEHALINNNPNDVPILSEYLSAYLQGNRNSIHNQRDSILWNGQMNALSSGFGAIGSAVSGNVGGLAQGVIGYGQGLGNTLLQLQGINAKIKDIGNMSPNMVKQGGNTNFDFGHGFTGLYVIKKQIKPEYRNKLEDFFNMFGYKLNEVKIPNFHTRQNWNFVQTKSCNIQANINNEDLQELKTIFDNGITLWHTDDVGNYSLTNEVI
ncbi:MAG TPA: hypothetical protein VNU45_14590, partial [Rummeliibacillus sp.]|nr:hypothetical protein [Rummeliibacillus sp.]